MSAPAPTSGKDDFADFEGSTTRRRWWLWVLLLLIAASLVAAAWMLMKPDPRRAAPGAVSSAPPVGMKPPAAAGADAPTPLTAAPLAPAAPGGSGASAPAGSAAAQSGASQPPGAARYPIERVMETEAPIDPATAGLDASASDKAITTALGTLPGREQLLRFVLPSDIARRLVLTIDNLPADSMSMQYRAVVATPGSFMVEKRQNETAIATRNASRYDGFVSFASSIDSKRLVALYKRFYPLLQKNYQEIGYPDRHFNDRVVQAIDDLLAAPTPKGPVFLDQPRVLYEYAESSIERRSVGQRMMVRIGPDHAARLKAKLREIRTLLTQEN